MELYKKVFINSPKDYPKEDGEYFCNRSGYMTVQKLLSNPPEKSYMREIRWYLQPIDETEYVDPEFIDYLGEGMTYDLWLKNKENGKDYQSSTGRAKGTGKA